MGTKQEKEEPAVAIHELPLHTVTKVFSTVDVFQKTELLRKKYNVPQKLDSMLRL